MNYIIKWGYRARLRENEHLFRCRYKVSLLLDVNVGHFVQKHWKRSILIKLTSYWERYSDQTKQQSFKLHLRLRKRIQERVKSQTSADSETVVKSLFIQAPLSGCLITHMARRIDTLHGTDFEALSIQIFKMLLNIFGYSSREDCNLSAINVFWNLFFETFPYLSV